MSDNWLQYVPRDPGYRPDPDMAEQARRLLASWLPRAQSVKARFEGTITFYHPMGNWSGVCCPSCGSDAEPWWDEALSRAFETEFTNLQINAACCGALVSLNELNYLWPAAFGSFVLEAMNPDSNGLSADQIAELHNVLGCNLTEIAVHL